MYAGKQDPYFAVGILLLTIAAPSWYLVLSGLRTSSIVDLEAPL